MSAKRQRTPHESCFVPVQERRSPVFPRQTVLLSPDNSGDSEIKRIDEWANLKEGLQLLDDANYWSKICPELHVGDVDGFQKSALESHAENSFIHDINITELKARAVDDGYFQVPAEALRLQSTDGSSSQFDYTVLANCVVKLMQLGWPPSFFLVFDEAWELARHCAKLVESTTGGNLNTLDLLLWYIDPNRDQSGFAPHRDRQPADSPKTFRPDGTPMYATCWLPFTDACSDNSCLFVLPKWADPGYFVGDPDDSEKTPLELALTTKQDFQNIRCLAAPAGSACVFSHRTIHWGSRGRKGYHTPRIAFSVASSADSFEEPYFSREKHLPFPPLRLRVALAAGQMLIYHERFNFSGKLLKLFFELFEKESASFSHKYSQQVQFEFISATTATTQANSDEDDAGSESDEVLDLVLDAILKRESAGFSDIVDDFDVSEGRRHKSNKQRPNNKLPKRRRARRG